MNIRRGSVDIPNNHLHPSLTFYLKIIPLLLLLMLFPMILTTTHRVKQVQEYSKASFPLNQPSTQALLQEIILFEIY